MTSPIPNFLNVVEQFARDQADAFAHCHMKDDPRAHEFIILLGQKLNGLDSRIGLNGRRGSTAVSALSWDALNFTGAGEGRDQFQRNCSVIDIAAGAGAVPPYSASNPAPRPIWLVFDKAPEANGAWIDPWSFKVGQLPPAQPDTMGKVAGTKAKGYEEIGGDSTGMAISRVMAFDYERAKGKLDKGCGAWMFRSCFVLIREQDGVTTAQQAIDKYRASWCAELGVPVIPVPSDF